VVHGTIDLASSYEVLSVFDAGEPSRCYDWSWQQAVRITSALVAASRVGVAPSPGYSGQASGSIGELMSRLSDAQLVAIEDAGPYVLTSGLRDTQEWAHRDVVELQDELRRLKRDSNFEPWLDWNVRGVWSEHTQRLGGLFDPALLTEVAGVLGISGREARRLLHESRNLRAIQRYTTQDRDTEGFAALCDAFVASALIRGRFHDRVAHLAGHQILHHPLRYGVLPLGTDQGGSTFVASEAEFIFANIIIAGTLEQPEHDRIGWWVRTVANARRHWAHLELARSVEDEPFSSRGQAEKRAFAAAETLEIGVSRKLDHALEWSFKLLPVGLSLLLMPWETIPLELIAIKAGDRAISRISRPIAAHVTKRTARLQDLAQSGPGRLEAPSSN
jgi:hypothetical protein